MLLPCPRNIKKFCFACLCRDPNQGSLCWGLEHALSSNKMKEGSYRSISTTSHRGCTPFFPHDNFRAMSFVLSALHLPLLFKPHMLPELLPVHTEMHNFCGYILIIEAKISKLLIACHMFTFWMISKSMSCQCEHCWHNNEGFKEPSQ